MTRIIKEIYLVIMVTILTVLYIGGIIGVEIISPMFEEVYKVLSNVVFISLFVIALILGQYLHNKRKSLLIGGAYEAIYGASMGYRLVYGLLGIGVVFMYVVMSVLMSYPPYFLFVVQLMLISRIFWDKIYITKDIIIIGNSVIERSKVQSAEILNDGVRKAIKFVIEGESYIIDFWNEEIQDHVLNKL